jgi:hypothetical protein
MVWKSMCGYFPRSVDGVHVGEDTPFPCPVSSMCTIGRIFFTILSLSFFSIQVITLHIREGWRHLTVLTMNLYIHIETKGSSNLLQWMLCARMLFVAQFG